MRTTLQRVDCVNRTLCALGLVMLAACCAPLCAQTPPVSNARRSNDDKLTASIERAVAYLAAETPKWRTEHRCASCHHQGAAARALLSARAKGWLDRNAPLENSLEWFAAPEKWKDNHGDPLASDHALAELQFGASLFASAELFPQRMKAPLADLAKMLAARQDAKGQFELEHSEGLPTPITLGPILLTGMARRVLESQGEAYAEPARRAREWLAAQSPRNPFEASSLLLALDGVDEKTAPKVAEVRRAARAKLLDAAHPDGGFGPYASSPAEPFDTALALLALSRDAESAQHAELIARAKEKLLTWQLDDGSFAETTRPSGGVSYAHRVATTAWALEALLEGAPAKRRADD